MDWPLALENAHHRLQLHRCSCWLHACREPQGCIVMDCLFDLMPCLISTALCPLYHSSLQAMRAAAGPALCQRHQLDTRWHLRLGRHLRVAGGVHHHRRGLLPAGQRLPSLHRVPGKASKHWGMEARQKHNGYWPTVWPSAAMICERSHMCLSIGRQQVWVGLAVDYLTFLA